MKLNNQKDRLLSMIRHGKPMTLGEQARLVLSLATPAILAQLTTTMMQYIDASMVGSLGAEASAAIGLIETTTWLMGSLCSATAAGFYVQVSHHITTLIMLGTSMLPELRSMPWLNIENWNAGNATAMMAK